MPESTVSPLLDIEIIEETVVFLDHLAQRFTYLNGRQDTPTWTEVREQGWALFDATFGDDQERADRLGARSNALTAAWARELARGVEEHA
jgi:hypothetical protein